MVIIEESGMQFGEYSEDDVYHIEKDSLYQRLNPNGIKSCEFILKKGNKLCFVEAKKTCPKQIETTSPDEKIEKYNNYINGVVEKMRHSLSLYASAVLKLQSNSAIPQALRTPDLSGKDIVLVLVVKEAEKDWLGSLQDKLRIEMKKDMRIWNCKQFFVINETDARKKDFVI